MDGISSNYSVTNNTVLTAKENKEVEKEQEKDSNSLFHDVDSKDGKRDFWEGLSGGWGVRMIDDKLNGKPVLRLANPVHTLISSDISKEDKWKSFFNPLSTSVNAAAFGDNEKAKNVADWILNPLGSLGAKLFGDKD